MTVPESRTSPPSATLRPDNVTPEAARTISPAKVSSTVAHDPSREQVTLTMRTVPGARLSAPNARKAIDPIRSRPH